MNCEVPKIEDFTQGEAIFSSGPSHRQNKPVGLLTGSGMSRLSCVCVGWGGGVGRTEVDSQAFSFNLGGDSNNLWE